MERSWQAVSVVAVALAASTLAGCASESDETFAHEQRFDNVDEADDGGWPTDEDEDLAFDVVEGRYRVTFKHQDEPHTAGIKLPRPVEALEVEADAWTPTDGDPEPLYGIGCWSSIDRDEGYVFGVIPGVGYVIERRPGGIIAGTELGQVPDRVRIRGVCRAAESGTTHLRMEVNGSVTAELDDAPGFGPFERAHLFVYATEREQDGTGRDDPSVELVRAVNDDAQTDEGSDT